jgi:UDP-N-acetylmuramoylalanine--D-glutamate ligase
MRRDRQPLQLKGRNALVMGLGTRQGGVGVTRFLVRQGANVTVTDLRAESDLQPALEALEGMPITYRLGEHREEDFDSADLVVRNPGVPRTSPWLLRARERGIPIEMEMSLFFRACPAPIIGITGTKGKTTTATICGRILRQMDPATVLAGNMGASALDQLDDITETTPVVLELSSWQLEGLAEFEMSPEIAVLTNISEDHLNTYDSFQHYAETKHFITRFQREQDWFIVNRNNPESWSSRTQTHAHVVPFGRLDTDQEGAGYEHQTLYWHRAGIWKPIIHVDELPFRSEPWIFNSLAASAAALLRGASLDDVRAGLTSVEPVPHRQEWVGTLDGVDYINDTTATAPAAAIAALETYDDRPIVLIAGGAGKNVSLKRFAWQAAHRADAIVLLDGDETAHLREMLIDAGAPRVSEPMTSMADAITRARAWASDAGVVLLSPACASFGLFRDEFHRGDEFRRIVQELIAQTSGETE